MKKLGVKTLSFVLSAAMLLSVMPVSAMAKVPKEVMVTEIEVDTEAVVNEELTCEEVEDVTTEIENEEAYPLRTNLDLFALDWKSAEDETISHYVGMNEWITIGMWLASLSQQDRNALLARDTLLMHPTYIEEEDGDVFEMLYHEYATKIYSEHEGEVFAAKPESTKGYWKTEIQKLNEYGQVAQTAVITHSISGIDTSLPTSERQKVTISRSVSKNWCGVSVGDSATHKTYKSKDGETYPYVKSTFSYNKPAGYTVSTQYSQTTSIYKIYWHHSDLFGGTMFDSDGTFSSCRHEYPSNATCNGKTTASIIPSTYAGKHSLCSVVNMYVNAGVGTTANATKGNMTQKIVLTPITYNVNYNGNGATSGASAAQNCSYGKVYTTQANGFSREYTVTYDGMGGTPAVTSQTAKYTFLGWGLNNTTTKTYTTGESFSNLTTTNNGTVTMNAIWQPKGVKLPNATREGYDFVKWNIGKTGKAGESYTPTSNVTAKAQWTPHQYKVVLDPNNGSAQKTINATYDKAFTLPTPEKAGYTFNGWKGNGGTYKGTVKNLTADNDVEVSLTADWIARGDVPYTVNRYKQLEESKEINLEDKSTYDEFKLEEGDPYPGTEVFYGTAGAMITVPAESVEGYQTPDAQLVTIAGDGSTVINFYYRLIKNDIFKYKVQHYIKKSPNGEYEIFETTEAFAEEGTIVSPPLSQDAIAEVNKVDGCICVIPQVQTVTITSDDTVFSYYYDCVKDSASKAEDENEDIAISDESINEIIKQLADGLSFRTEIDGVTYEITQKEDGTLAIKFSNTTDAKVLIPDVVTIGEKVYQITEISKDAFKNNTTIKEVELSPNIQKIGERAFQGCSSLEKITMREGVVTIGSYAFDGCKSLKSIKTPKSLQTIDSYAFQNCTSLKTLTLNKGLLTIGKKAFYNCKSITSLKIPKTVLKIREYAFGKCSKIKTVTFVPVSQLLLMEKGVFANCTSLTKITLPEKLRNIPAKGFYKCTKLGNVKIGSQVTKIGNSAFEGCKKIRSILIPNKVQTIGAKAFYKCATLKKVTIRSKAITSVGSKAFKGCEKGIKFLAPKSKLASYKALFKGKY